MTTGASEVPLPSPLRSSFTAVGAYLMPVTEHAPRSGPERAMQFRAGVVGVVSIAAGLAGIVVAAVWLAVHPAELAASLTPMPVALIGATLLAALSVFAPRPVVRTRSEAFTKDTLRNPTAPVRPWRSTTITFTMVPVGALVAGVYYDAALMAVLFGLALTVRALVLAQIRRDRDPNARYHAVVQVTGAAMVAVAAFAIVKPLSTLISGEAAVVPILLASIVATYVGLFVASLDGWVESDRTRWGLVREALDSRRIIVALVAAVLAWTIVVGGQWFTLAYPQTPYAGLLAGLGIFLAGLLLLWFVSIRMWVHESLRTLALWAQHHSEVLGRIADGSLSPELAARAAVPITARMALTVFGATRAMVVLDDGRGRTTTHLAAVDVYPHGPRPEPRDLADPGALRVGLYPVPGHPNGSNVTVGGWLWAGWFIARSRRIVGTFSDLATATLLTPIVSSNDDRDAAAFEVMFDGINRWPTMTAFGQAVERMQSRADANPHTHSLILGVLSIDEFGALAGGRFEQAAVAQVMRLAVGHQQFAGHDVFAAYEEPGRIWLALGGGPIIRNGIGLLRGLQEHINERGSVPSARMDVDVHVSVSFGYAAHQVDEFTLAGLLAAARGRLSIDHGARDPFAIDDLASFDFGPEDITQGADTPITAVDTLNLLQADADDPACFPAWFSPIVDTASGQVGALLLRVGWRRTLDSLDLADPDAFLALTGRQTQVAAAATMACLARAKEALDLAEAAGHRDLPLMLELPAILLLPEAAEHALPNLVTPFLDRRECALTVVLVNEVPPGSGQALRTLADRGVSVAVTAGAAAGASPADLYGWLRWGVVFPQRTVQGPAGIDSMTIQQTASAIATRDTRLIALADETADRRALAGLSVQWTVDPAQHWASAAEALPSLRDV